MCINHRHHAWMLIWKDLEREKNNKLYEYVYYSIMCDAFMHMYIFIIIYIISERISRKYDLWFSPGRQKWESEKQESEKQRWKTTFTTHFYITVRTFSINMYCFYYKECIYKKTTRKWNWGPFFLSLGRSLQSHLTFLNFIFFTLKMKFLIYIRGSSIGNPLGVL